MNFYAHPCNLRLGKTANAIVNFYDCMKFKQKMQGLPVKFIEAISFCYGFEQYFRSFYGKILVCNDCAPHRWRAVSRSFQCNVPEAFECDPYSAFQDISAHLRGSGWGDLLRTDYKSKIQRRKPERTEDETLETSRVGAGDGSSDARRLQPNRTGNVGTG